MNVMASAARRQLALPDWAAVPPIPVRDPFLEFLGLIAEGEPFAVTFADLVKTAGHVCPTVAGAYLVSRHGLSALYGDAPAVRGQVRVTAYGGPTDFGYGPISQLVNVVIGAAPETGFGGLGPGRFRRRDLFVFRADDVRQNEFDFERLDMGRCVRVVYRPSAVPAPEGFSALVAAGVVDGAAPEAVARFREAWLQRVRDILANEGRVLAVSERC